MQRLGSASSQSSIQGSMPREDGGRQLGPRHAARDHLRDDRHVAAVAVLRVDAGQDRRQLLGRLRPVDRLPVPREPLAARPVEGGEQEAVEAAEVVEDQRLVEASARAIARDVAPANPSCFSVSSAASTIWRRVFSPAVSAVFLFI